MFISIMSVISKFAIPFMIVGIISFGIIRKVKVYEAFTDGAAEGFSTAIRIIPFFIAMLVAIGVFRESGAMELLIKALSPITKRFNMPGELVPMALMRPLSGGGAQGLMTEIITTHGPESILARTAAVMMGSTETTLYVLAVYFGSISIKKQGQAMTVGLIADMAGLIAAVIVSRLYFG